MTDYGKELEKYKGQIDAGQTAELERLASMQKDIAIGGTAEDFVRHPFFKVFENHMNDVINDSKGKILALETMEDLKALKAGIAAVSELKLWINTHVMKGRVARQAIELYEADTEKMNVRIQEEVSKSHPQ